MKKLIIICFIFFSCNLLLDPGQKWGFDYYDIHLYYRSKIGGIWVYYLQNDGRSARIAFENRFNDFWIEEGWEDERYSYEAGWVRYHVAQIRRDHINIGWKKP
jgi:hypothetical protein